MPSPTVIVVDGYSSGALLAPEFAKHGWKCIHVRTAENIQEIYRSSYRPECFAREYVYKGDLFSTLADVREWAPVAVLSGVDTGIELADALAEALKLDNCNARALSSARRDKYLMIEAVRGAGLRAAAQIKAKRLDEAVAWANALQDWPVVIKPLHSAGTDGVQFCYNEKEVARAFEAIHNRYNRLGALNEEVLVQSFLRGKQFFVNTVSFGGRHLIAEIWGENKRQVANAAFINDLEYLLPHQGAVQEQLSIYTTAILDALGIAYGPAHTELMLTADGPVLVETAARMMGSIDHNAVVDALGYSQISLTVESIIDPQKFMARMKDSYQIKNNIYCVALISEQEGVVSDSSGVNRVKALPSFRSILRIPSVGSTLSRTVDFCTSPGIVYLIHEDKSVMDKDYHQIREWEKSGMLFTVE